jgi:hypothetical protein
MQKYYLSGKNLYINIPFDMLTLSNEGIEIHSREDIIFVDKLPKRLGKDEEALDVIKLGLPIKDIVIFSKRQFKREELINY